MQKRVLFTTVVFAALTCGIFGQQPGIKAPGTASPAAEKDFVISTTSHLVLLDVSVKDTAGGFVAGLTKDNFRIMEDGKPQNITQFADADIPVTIGLVIDESGSMRPKRPEVITAGLAFIQASNPQDEMFVLNFNERVRHGLPDTMMFSDNIKQLRAALSSGVPEGRTALYDAIVDGLKQLEMGRKDKKTLIVVSDGGDNISKATLKDVVKLVEESVATIYTIGVFDQDDPDRNPGVLKRLAEISGGQAYFPEKLEGIVPICRGIAKEIRTRYTIGYIPTMEGKKVRHIKIAATAPDRGKLVARTRTLYAFPDEGQMTARSK
ncbi:MAG: VWA domain-containing protein [Acidobacteriota bacterium]|nr:VWA domain-containing protein [Acidobacteriota bacterium]